LRVLHLGKFYPPHPGGIERFTAELVEAQQRDGLQPAVLAHAAGGAAPGPEAEAAIRLVPSYGRLLFVPLSPGWLPAFLRMLRQTRPDLLHIHLPNPSAFFLLGLPQARALPWVLHWHSDVPDDSPHRGLRWAYPLYHRFERRLLARAAVVLATSGRYRDASRALRPALPRTEVVPLGLGSAPAAGPAPIWPAPGLRLLAVGRLSFYKGFEVLLDALATVADASLLLIGDGEQQRALAGRIERLGLGGRVRMLGRVDDAGLQAAYEACDVLCLPSLDRSEAFGLVLLEAMRAARPVLASDIPGSGVGEVVQDGVTGRLVPLRDVPAWAAAIGWMAAHPQQRMAMGEAGRARFAGEFRIEPVARRITSIYRGLLGADAAAG
jgi:glycosyltransferase involved in cell wall biosynthesis